MAPYSVKLNPAGVAVIAAVTGFSLLYLMSGSIFSSKDEVSLKELLSVSIHLTEKAGVKVKVIRDKAQIEEESKGNTIEGATELVTRGDKESNRIIMSGLQKGFPGLKVISEEKHIEALNFRDIPVPSKSDPDVDALIPKDTKLPMKDVTVWVDPLDATKEYTENLRQYVTVMICVAVRGQPVIGVIHKPFFHKTYWGWAGKGRTSILPKVSPAHTEGQEKIIVSRSHTGDVKEVAEKNIPGATVIPAGGAGYKTLEVILGNATAYVHTTRIKKWDICAGHALLRSYSQGRLTDLRGDSVSYGADAPIALNSGLIASTSRHQLYVNKLKDVADKAAAHNAK